MVKIFTMVKDEIDIVRDWLIYHGSMFGFGNIYIIDNYSTDGTYELLINMSLEIPIHVSRLPNYALKGKYMKKLIEKYGKDDKIAYPIDIDEFVVLYNKENNTIDINKQNILHYIDNLPEHKVYKTNYIISKITKENGYDRATIESTHGYYSDYGKNAKSFFNTKLFKNVDIDHGNHYETSDYYLTDICLVHYHWRNTEQMKTKILNNVLGFGYKNELEYLKSLPSNCNGSHHVQNQIHVLENTYCFPNSQVEPSDILLEPLANRIRNGFF